MHLLKAAPSAKKVIQILNRKNGKHMVLRTFASKFKYKYIRIYVDYLQRILITVFGHA